MADRANNPLEINQSANVSQPVSSYVFPIAGILTTVYGLDELPANTNSVSCLWLLHPRLQTQKVMEPIASHAIHLHKSRGKPTNHGLIAVSFDQRNHGSREIDSLANEAWRQGNERHAIDMFSTYHGTAVDTSLLLMHLPSYLAVHFSPKGAPTITQNIILGISLGGHAAWHVLLQLASFDSAAIIIGCPDYTALMKQRAEKSKRSAWTSSTPPGSSFIGSTDFPQGLVETVRSYDPVGSLCTAVNIDPRNVSETAVRYLQMEWAPRLQGKKIINLSGGSDKLVPYACGEPFLKLLKKVSEEREFAQNIGFSLDDRVYEGVGHECTRQMEEDAVNWVLERVVEAEGAPTRDAKL